MSRRGALAAKRAAAAERKAERDDARAQPAAVGSYSLAASLLDLWAWGDMTAKTVQRLAQAGVEDACLSKALSSLAQLGARGSSAQNCQRDLLRLLKRHLPAKPEPVHIRIPIVRGKDEEGVRTVSQPYLPLHRVFAHAHANYPEQFARSWGTREGVLAFWAGLREGDPNAAQWASKMAHKDLASTIPYAIHGDGVPVFRHKSLECWSANSLLAEGGAKQVKSLMFCYWTHLRAKLANDGADTEASLWEVIKWDLEALFQGKHPCLDWQQNPWRAEDAEKSVEGSLLAGGMCGVPWILKGDLDHFAQVLQLESTASHTPCFYCRADHSLLPFTDFSAQAAWKATAWRDNDEWRAAHPERHPALSILCLGVFSVHADVLHTLALGIAQSLVANVLWLLVYRTMPGSAQDNLLSVWTHILAFYKAHGTTTQIRKLTARMFLPSEKAPRKNYPKMTTKGKETEYLAEAVLSVWEEFRSRDAHDGSVAVVLSCLERVFSLSRKVGGSLHLAEEDSAEIRASLDSLLLHYTALGNRAAAQGDMLWNITPTFHVAWHWAWQTQFLHPHASSCYVDESFVGVIAKIAKSSTGGQKLERVGTTVLAKYSLGASVQLAMSPGSRFQPWL